MVVLKFAVESIVKLLSCIVNVTEWLKLMLSGLIGNTFVHQCIWISIPYSNVGLNSDW